MKTALVALLFAASAFAQTPSSRIAPACGPKDVSFGVKLDNTQHALLQPEPGKARVYFVQDDGPQYYTLKIGLDGAWVGAYKETSHLTVSVEPGEHHVCANVQIILSGKRKLVELAHFTAEAGKIYYFRTRTVPSQWGLYLFLEEVDSDQAKYLIASYPLSVSYPKK